MHDVLVVGAGISAAAACAVLKKHCKVLVVENRSHLGGNCYDYVSQGTKIHRYGAHLWHCPNPELQQWMSQFTEWDQVSGGVHAATAEIIDPVGGLAHVPFPYSKETEKALGYVMNDQQITDLFFRGYSQKMWGKPWDELPDSIRNRVPKRGERSDFFPGQFQGLPKYGYTCMIENMFDGCDVILGAGPQDWYRLIPPSGLVIYCGRLDLIKNPSTGLAIGSDIVRWGDTNRGKKMLAAWLQHVTLDFSWHNTRTHQQATGVLNICHTRSPQIRFVLHRLVTGGHSSIWHTETPRHNVSHDELAPTHVAPATEDSRMVLDYLKARAKELYPGLLPLGRVAQHQYLDMHQAAGAGRKLGGDILRDLGVAGCGSET